MEDNFLNHTINTTATGAINTTTDLQDEFYNGKDDDLVAMFGNEQAEQFRFHLSQMTLTRNEQLIKICVMTISSFLSILGSGTILFFCRKKLHRIYHRLLFMLSASDLLFSISYIFQPYAVPTHYQVPFGIGSISSCRTVGFFFMTFSLTGCLLNCCLTLYFYMTIVEGKTEAYLVRKMEKPWYMICATVPLTLSIAGVWKQSINPDSYNKMCIFDGIPGDTPPSTGFIIGMSWFGIVLLSSGIGFRSTYLVYSKVRDRTKRMERYNFLQQQQRHHQQQNPSSNNVSIRNINVNDSSNHSQNNNNNNNNNVEVEATAMNTTNVLKKTRSVLMLQSQSRVSFRGGGGGGGGASFRGSVGSGGGGASFRGSVGSGGGGASFRVGSGSGGTSFRSVTSASSQQKRVAAVATQAVLYSLAYLNSIIWPTAVAIVSAALSKMTGELYILDLAVWLFYPLQGFLNFFVYIRPTYLQWRRAYPQKSRLWALWQIWEFHNTMPQQQSSSRRASPPSSIQRQNSLALQRQQRQRSGRNLSNRLIILGENDNEDWNKRNNNNNDNNKNSKSEQDFKTMLSQTINNNNGLIVLNEARQENSFESTPDNDEDEDEDHDDDDDDHHHSERHIKPLKLQREDGFVFDDSDCDPEDGDVMEEEDGDPKAIATATRRSRGGSKRWSDFRADVRRTSTMSEGVSAFFDLDLQGAKLSSSEFEQDEHDDDEEHQQHQSFPLSGSRLSSNNEDDATWSRGDGKKKRTKSQPTMFTTFRERDTSLQSLPSSGGGGGGGDGSRSLSSSRRSQFSLTRAWSSFWSHEDNLEGDVKSSTQSQAQQQQEDDQKDMPRAPSKGEELQDFSATSHDRDHPHELTFTSTKGMECISSSPVSDSNQELPSYDHVRFPSLEAIENNECHETVPETCIEKDPVCRRISHPHDGGEGERDEISVVSA